jgi:hypothetical protein
MKPLHYLLTALLFACLLDLPYGYYQFVRWAAMVGFVVLAYYYHERGATKVAIVFVGLALLFQPLAKVALGREVWNVVDVLVGVGLIWVVNHHLKSPALPPEEVE